jgi:UDPglucose 6-dehydrogenase
VKVGVAGLWHLGTVTAGCLASAGHEVTAYDGDAPTVARLRSGELPVAEPGLAELIAEATAARRLSFTSSPADLAGVEVTWVAYDTPVDEHDRADVEAVVGAVSELLPFVGQDSLVLISSQLPVGSTRRLEGIYRRLRPDGTASFGYSPENLRLGSAVDAFTRPARVVVGVRASREHGRVGRLLAPFTERIEWMTVESAEMTKHALNSFLATSVAFANELAGLCERIGADAGEVERGLKTDARIGPRAYLRPGGAFAGGTLARDVSFLIEMGRAEGLPTHLMSAVQESNQAHKDWPRRRLVELVGDPRGKAIAILGLTYKPGTDTLRRSTAVEIARWLGDRGANITAYDPAVRALPAELGRFISLRPSIAEALHGADAMLVATEWPEFSAISADSLVGWMKQPIVLDAARFLQKQLGADERIRYVSVGRAA